MKAELVPENGEAPIPIVRDVTIVGRREYCDVVIDHPGLSKRHCILVKTDGLLVIRDLATTNGTKVKGQKVRWAALLPDDRISLGGYKLRVYLGPDDMPSPSEQFAARARGKGPGARGAEGLDRPVVAGISRWPEPAPGTARRGSTTAGFPEPSGTHNTARPELDNASPAPDPWPVATTPSAPAPFQFELLEDDDEIIDLE
jgi:pSer/pThr/pTyr-binding forkhead associated (FHA) protein